MLGRPAWAHDVQDELTVGSLSSNFSKGTTPYVSDRLGFDADASDALVLSVNGTYTRYLRSNHTPGESIFLLAGAADYSPSDHFSFGVDVRGSPPSTEVTRVPASDTTTTVPSVLPSGPAGSELKSRTSLIGAGLSAEYDTAGEGPFESIVDASAGATSYMTTQVARALGGGASTPKRSPSSLGQYRMTLGFIEVLQHTTQAELSASYYVYSSDPTGTGYFGASVFGREAVSDGVPVEPLRWLLRPTLRQRIGPVKLSAFFQYGRYVDDGGVDIGGGVKAQVKVGSAWKLWASLSYQRDQLATGEVLAIPWGGIGAKVAF
jgi:hypothetical protein